MTLTQISEVLLCSRAAASRLRAGTYDVSNSNLPRRYAMLVEIAQSQQPDLAACAHAICVACPRDDCTGCRVADIPATERTTP